MEKGVGGEAAEGKKNASWARFFAVLAVGGSRKVYFDLFCRYRGGKIFQEGTPSHKV